jgi:signal transduction histidine kinase
MRRFVLARGISLAFGSAVIILLAVAAFAYRGQVASTQAQQWVAHTQEVLQTLWALRLDIADVEADDERYILTRDPAHLDAARASLAGAGAYVAAIGRLTADNPRQQLRIPALQAMLAQKLARVDSIPAALQTEGLAGVIKVVRAGAGHRLENQTQAAVQAMQDEELRLLSLRKASEEGSLNQTTAVFAVGALLALMITAVAGWTVSRDRVRRQRAEAEVQHKIEELHRSNEELGAFAAVASHDLQEPLRMVGSYLQLLSRRYKGKLDAEADEFIAFAVDGASRMQLLIQDLLAYSRVGTTDRTPNFTSSEAALQQALLNLRIPIADSGAVVTHDALPTVMADEIELTQLFQNLVGNAIKYQKPGTPLIHVSAAKGADKKWLFAVRDNGLGIEPQYFEKIFGMFQRLHGREEFSGTGIGLAICKKIVERHGGSISVESQAGHGSTFRFALPATG